MKHKAMKLSRGLRHRGLSVVQRTLGGLTLVVVHELGALAGHWAEVRERAAVAGRAQGVGELIRDQMDLLPETRLRLSNDRRERRELLRDWVREIRAGLGSAA